MPESEIFIVRYGWNCKIWSGQQACSETDGSEWQISNVSIRNPEHSYTRFYKNFSLVTAYETAGNKLLDHRHAEKA